MQVVHSGLTHPGQEGYLGRLFALGQFQQYPGPFHFANRVFAFPEQLFQFVLLLLA